MSDTPEQRMITYLRNLGYDVSSGDSADARSMMDKLENQINEVESRSGLMSKSGFTRVITTLGYVFIAYLLIGLVIVVLWFFFGLLGS